MQVSRFCALQGKKTIGRYPFHNDRKLINVAEFRYAEHKDCVWIKMKNSIIHNPWGLFMWNPTSPETWLKHLTKSRPIISLHSINSLTFDAQHLQKTVAWDLSQCQLLHIRPSSLCNVKLFDPGKYKLPHFYATTSRDFIVAAEKPENAAPVQQTLVKPLENL